MTDPPHAELHCHSTYSFLDGASMPDELVPAALELGYDALALTDHNSLSASMELAQAARGLGLRAIHGAELDLDDGRHLTLLVEDACGWSNRCRLVTYARAKGRRPAVGPARGAGRRPRPRRGPRLPHRLRRARHLAGEGEPLGLYGFGASAHIVCQIARATGRRVFAFTRSGDTASRALARELGAEWIRASAETPPPEPLGRGHHLRPGRRARPDGAARGAKGAAVACAGIHMSDIPAFPTATSTTRTVAFRIVEC